MGKETWAAYCQYLRDWADSHRDVGFEGCCPSCYDEFLDGDLQFCCGGQAVTKDMLWRCAWESAYALCTMRTIAIHLTLTNMLQVILWMDTPTICRNL